MQAIHQTLRARLEDTFARHVPRNSRVALIGFPNYPNAGDSAIWLGERALLEGRGARVTYSCEDWAYGRQAVARALGSDGMLLLHGGGNIGDEWPTYETWRQRILTDFPDVPALVMPQTVHFKDGAALERARAVYTAHRDLTILVRDQRSLTLAREGLGVNAELCPDAAFALTPPSLPGPPEPTQLWLSRTDEERRSARLLPPEGTPARVADWLVCRRPSDPGFTWGYQALKLASIYAGAPLTRRPRGTALAPGLVALHEAIATRRVDTAWEMLGEAEVVVTDRLHAHVLCLMLGKPHVVVETGYGKIREFAAAWAGDGEYPVQIADDAEEAAAMAGAPR